MVEEINKIDADRQKDRQTDRQTDRKTDRQTVGQADGQTGRQTDRQTDRLTKIVFPNFAFGSRLKIRKQSIFLIRNSQGILHLVFGCQLWTLLPTQI